MATGKRAFQKATAIDTLAAILHEEPEPIARLNPQAPVPLRWIIEQCLAKEAKDRYASTEDLFRELRRVRDHLSEASLSGESIPAVPTSSRRRLGYVVAAAALLAVSGGLFTLGRRSGEKLIPSFQRLTFRRGSVGYARFAHDGQTIVYGAAWEGGPMRLYSTQVESPQSRLFDLPPADILSISSSGEMAILLNPKSLYSPNRFGTLARVPLSGGAPREILEDVQGADWSPDGKSSPCPQDRRGRRLEFPIGKTLYEAETLFSPRVSPDGKLVAFIEDREGVSHLCVIDAAGKRRTLADDLEGPLAWSPKGDEILCGGLDAVSLAGRRRVLARFPAFAAVSDVSQHSGVLLTLGEWRMGIAALPAGETQARDLSWFGVSWTARGLPRRNTNPVRREKRNEERRLSSQDGRLISAGSNRGRRRWTGHLPRFEVGADSSGWTKVRARAGPDWGRGIEGF